MTNPEVDLPVHLLPYYNEYLDKLEAAWNARDASEFSNWLWSDIGSGLEYNADARLLLDAVCTDLVGRRVTSLLDFNGGKGTREFYDLFKVAEMRASARNHFFYDFRRQTETPKAVFYIITDNDHEDSLEKLKFFSTSEAAEEVAALLAERDTLMGRVPYSYQVKSMYLNRDLHMVRDWVRGYGEDFREEDASVTTVTKPSLNSQAPEDFEVEFPKDLPPQCQAEFREYRYRMSKAEEGGDTKDLHWWLQRELGDTMDNLQDALVLVNAVSQDLMNESFQVHILARQEDRELDENRWLFIHDLKERVDGRRLFLQYFGEQVEMPQAVFYMITDDEDGYPHGIVGCYSTEAAAEEAEALHLKYAEDSGDEETDFIIMDMFFPTYLNIDLNICRRIVERERERVATKKE